MSSMRACRIRARSLLARTLSSLLPHDELEHPIVVAHLRARRAHCHRGPPVSAVLVAVEVDRYTSTRVVALDLKCEEDRGRPPEASIAMNHARSRGCDGARM